MSKQEVKNMQEKIKMYRKDISLFASEVFKFTPTPQQDAVFKDIVKPGARVSVKAGHGVGKTAMLAVIVWWHVLLFPDSKSPCTAPTKTQLEDVLWAELAKMREQAHPWFKEQMIITATHAQLKGSEKPQFASARTSSKDKPEALQGFHAKNLLFVIDEGSGVDDVVFAPMEGALSTEGARAIMCSNPTRPSGYFYETHNKNRKYWSQHTLSCIDSELVSKKYIEQAKDSYGEQSDFYKIRVLGEFPSASAKQLIGRDLVMAAIEKVDRPNAYDYAPVILGVDVAWHGDDRSAIYMRQGLGGKLLNSWYDIDNVTLAGVVAQQEDKYKADAVFIDVGWGAGVIDTLRGWGRNPQPVNFGGRSIQDRFFNKRTEMWVLLKEWLESGANLDDNPDLLVDLTGPEYSFNPSGKIVLERKEDMKKRGMASPDLGDALALTFAAPVYKKDNNTNSMATTMAVTDYDVLA